MGKKELSTNAAKAEFVKSIHHWLMLTLEQNNKPEYKKCFTIEGSSIMCKLPQDYFNLYNIPANTKIEMKFISKKE